MEPRALSCADAAKPVMLEIIGFINKGDKLTLICDDDEETATNFFRLYRVIKNRWPPAKQTLAAISFADDKVLFGLQASDCVAALIRMEAGRALLGAKYRYRQLYKALIKQPERHERIWQVSIGIGDRNNLQRLAENLKGELERVQEKAKEQQEQEQLRQQRLQQEKRFRRKKRK